MAMFSKNVKTVLTYLAILIILYGAYKAIVNVQEGAKSKKGGNRFNISGLKKIKSGKSTKKYCKKWTKNIKKQKRKMRKTKNIRKKTKLENRIQGLQKKMCYVGCKQVGQLGLSCGAGGAGGAGGGAGGAGGAGGGAGGCSVEYSSKAEWDELFRQWKTETPAEDWDHFQEVTKTDIENNYLKNNCIPKKIFKTLQVLKEGEDKLNGEAILAASLFYRFSTNYKMTLEQFCSFFYAWYEGEVVLPEQVLSDIDTIIKLFRNYPPPKWSIQTNNNNCQGENNVNISPGVQRKKSKAEVVYRTREGALSTTDYVATETATPMVYSPSGAVDNNVDFAIKNYAVAYDTNVKCLPSKIYNFINAYMCLIDWKHCVRQRFRCPVRWGGWEERRSKDGRTEPPSILNNIDQYDGVCARALFFYAYSTNYEMSLEKYQFFFKRVVAVT